MENKTMHEAYGEPNNKFGKHLVCQKCGRCINCGDCICKKKEIEKELEELHLQVSQLCEFIRILMLGHKTDRRHKNMAENKKEIKK